LHAIGWASAGALAVHTAGGQTAARRCAPGASGRERGSRREGKSGGGREREYSNNTNNTLAPAGGGNNMASGMKQMKRGWEGTSKQASNTTRSSAGVAFYVQINLLQQERIDEKACGQWRNGGKIVLGKYVDSALMASFVQSREAKWWF